MPESVFTFTEVCTLIGASPTTVKKRMAELGVEPRRTAGRVKLYTRSQAERVRRHHAATGGRWPARR